MDVQFQSFQDGVRNRLGHCFIAFPGRHELFVRRPDQSLRRALARQAGIQKGAYGVDVRPGTVGVYRRVLFRRGIPGEQLRRQFRAGRPDCADGKASDFCGIMGGYKDGIRADAPVQDPVLMQKAQSFHGGHQKVGGFLPCEHGSLLHQIIPQRNPFHMLHNSVNSIVGLYPAQNLDHAGKGPHPDKLPQNLRKIPQIGFKGDLAAVQNTDAAAVRIPDGKGVREKFPDVHPAAFHAVISDVLHAFPVIAEDPPHQVPAVDHGPGRQIRGILGSPLLIPAVGADRSRPLIPHTSHAQSFSQNHFPPLPDMMFLVFITLSPDSGAWRRKGCSASGSQWSWGRRRREPA